MIDFDILKQFGSTNAKLREVLSCTDESAEYHKHRKRIEERICSRVDAGIRLSLSHSHLYAASDLAWDTSMITKENIPLMLYAQKKIKIERCGTELERLGCAKDFVRKNSDGIITEIDVPRLYETAINLVRSYITRRVAAQATNFNNLYPCFKYEPRSTDPVGNIRGDALSQRMEIMVDQYGYRHLQTQIIRDMFLYTRSVIFPACAWDKEVQWVKAKTGSGLAPTTDKKFTVESKVVREGLDFVRPHPSRIFWDISYPLASINTDTGCRYIGYWDVKRYADVMNDPAYFNRDKIRITNSGRTLYDGWQLYFDSTFTGCQIKFSGCDALRPPLAEGEANDRQALAPYYNDDEGDESMFVTEYFEKIIPKDYCLGDYPFPVWVRFVVASDDTVIYAEFLPSTPAVYFGFNENDTRYVNISPAHEILPFQDQVTNLLSQLLLTAKSNALKVVTLDIDMVDETMREAVKKTLQGKDYYVHPLLLEYSGVKARNLGVNASSPLNLVERNGGAEINTYFSAIAQILSIVERLLVLSPQELGQAAPREISATEVNQISNSTSTVYGFIGDAIDEGRAAWKKLCYESLISKSSTALRVPVLDRYPDTVIEAAGFKSDVPAGVEDPRLAQQMVTGSAEALVHDYTFSSRDGAEREVNTAASQNLVQLGQVILSSPVIMQAVGKERLYRLINEVFRLSGSGFDMKLEMKPGEEDGFGPSPEDTQAAMTQLTGQLQQLAGQVQQNQQGLDQVVQVLQQALNGAPAQGVPTRPGEVAPGVPGVAVAQAPVEAAPVGGANPIALGLQQ